MKLCTSYSGKIEAGRGVIKNMNSNRVILHIDMNSYFASVEQQANPFLRGKAVGVCAYLSENGCIIASSMEAKKVGVVTGTRVREARKLYPKIVLVENEPAKYRSVTEKIFSILSEYTDRLEPYSIDEAFLDLTGWRDARAIALEIRRRINTEVGNWLKCSIGISYTRWLAKFASDIADKNTTLVLRPEKLDKTLSRRALTDAWGINYRLKRRLNALGIFTLYNLKHYPVANLMRVLGRLGYFLWANVNGIEIGGVTPHQEIQPKSIGHSYCLPKKTTDKKYLRSILMKLCEKIGRRLRDKRLEAQNIGAYMNFVSGNGYGKQFKTPTPLFDTMSIFKHADRILFSYPLPDRARMLAVRVADLIPLQTQQSFFGDILKTKNIALACDAINNKFGEYTITSGQMLGISQYAKDRIGYRKTIELPRESS